MEFAVMAAAGFVGDDDFIGGCAPHPGHLPRNQTVHLAVFQPVADDKKGTGSTQTESPERTATK
jgi:hypothetical protein